MKTVGIIVAQHILCYLAENCGDNCEHALALPPERIHDPSAHFVGIIVGENPENCGDNCENCGDNCRESLIP